ncbi:MAG: hypothetical protein U0002_11620 [Thermoanaerobaculia bacterium]
MSKPEPDPIAAALAELGRVTRQAAPSPPPFRQLLARARQHREAERERRLRWATAAGTASPALALALGLLWRAPQSLAGFALCALLAAPLALSLGVAVAEAVDLRGEASRRAPG